MSESQTWTAYQRSMVEALMEFQEWDTPLPVMVRVYCEKHGRQMARVVDLPGHGAFLVLGRPTKLSPKVVRLHDAFPEKFDHLGDRVLSDPHYELLEHPDVREEAVLNVELTGGGTYMGGWCGEGHRLSLPDLDALLDAVCIYRRGSGVKKLTT